MNEKATECSICGKVLGLTDCVAGSDPKNIFDTVRIDGVDVQFCAEHRELPLKEKAMKVRLNWKALGKPEQKAAEPFSGQISKLAEAEQARVECIEQGHSWPGFVQNHVCSRCKCIRSVDERGKVVYTIGGAVSSVPPACYQLAKNNDKRPLDWVLHGPDIPSPPLGFAQSAGVASTLTDEEAKRLTPMPDLPHPQYAGEVVNRMSADLEAISQKFTDLDRRLKDKVLFHNVRVKTIYQRQTAMEMFVAKYVAGYMGIPAIKPEPGETIFGCVARMVGYDVDQYAAQAFQENLPEQKERTNASYGKIGTPSKAQVVSIGADGEPQGPPRPIEEVIAEQRDRFKAEAEMTARLLKDADGKVEQLHKANLIQAEDIKFYIGQRDALDAQVNELKAQLKACEAYQEVQRQLALMTSERDDLGNLVESYRENTSGLQERLSSKVGECEALEKELHTLTRACDLLTESVNALGVRATTAEAGLQNAEERANNLQEFNADLEAENTRCAIEIIQLEKERDLVIAKKAVVEEKCVELTREREGYRHQYHTQGEYVEELEKTRASLQDDRAQRDAHILRMEDANDELREKIKGLEKELKTVTTAFLAMTNGEQ